MKQGLLKICAALLAVLLLFSACKNPIAPVKPETTAADENTQASESVSTEKSKELTLDDIPEYSGSAYVEINGSVPEFTNADLVTEAYEHYGELDRLGRCRACMACLGKELMPTEKRGDISSIKPTGWQKIRYGFVDGGSLYNRCHLIAFQLAGENANPKNLITGTRYMNATGMLPFEEKTGNYIRETGNHVIYRVTPMFSGDELVARGVHMEAYSVEDEGKGICFNVYCYNVQPGIRINYLTGEAELESESAETSSKAESATASDVKYIINKNNKKFHKPECDSIQTISEKNKLETDKDRETLIKEGYTPCGSCKP